MTSTRFSKAIRTKVASASDRLPTLGEWLERVRAIGDPMLTEAIEGIWCGREGRAVIDMPGTKVSLCVGWYNGRVEFSYIS